MSWQRYEAIVNIGGVFGFECPGWVASRRWAAAGEIHRLSGGNRPRVCKKSELCVNTLIKPSQTQRSAVH